MGDVSTWTSLSFTIYKHSYASNSLEQHFAILGTNLALSRYVYRHFLGKDATNQSTARRSIPLSGRRKYTTITKSHSIGNGQDTSSQYNLRPMEPSVIRATTEIDIRSSFHSDPEPASFTHYNAFGDEMAPKAGRDEILLNKLAWMGFYSFIF